MTTILSPLSQFLEQPEGAAAAVASSVFYGASFVIVVWKHWPLRIGLLMLAFGFIPSAWLAERGIVDPLSVLYGMVTIPIILIAVGAVSSGARVIRQLKARRESS